MKISEDLIASEGVYQLLGGSQVLLSVLPDRRHFRNYITVMRTVAVDGIFSDPSSTATPSPVTASTAMSRLDDRPGVTRRTVPRAVEIQELPEPSKHGHLSSL